MAQDGGEKAECKSDALLEKINSFVAEQDELDSVPWFDQPLPKSHHPLIFTKRSQVFLGDIQQMLEGFMVKMFGVEQVAELKCFHSVMFGESKLFEYLIEICR